MINLNSIQQVYMLGIGGIGMSALARYFVYRGIQVAGYDKMATALTMELEREGIAIHYEDDKNLIPENTGLVVYTPAIPSSLNEFSYCISKGWPFVKRSELLGLITKEMFTIAVAGTHGKTTISSMIAHLLRDTGYGCNAFLGGITANYHTNYWYHENPVAVAEADEYDKSFLALSPSIAVISSMDADHLEIYGDAGAMENAYREFASKLKADGLLLVNKAIENAFNNAQCTSYSVNDMNADAYAYNITNANGSFYFDVNIKGNILNGFYLPMPGLHNLSNMLAAITVAHTLKIEEEKIKKAVAGFKGVRRRFEYLFRSAGADKSIVYIDDYAHHPAELKALIEGITISFQGYRTIGIFQPHLFSRTKEFYEEFALELDKLNEVILLPVYPAREQPIEGVNSQLIMGSMQQAHVQIMEIQQVADYITKRLPGAEVLQEPLLITTIGAGSIEKLREPLKIYLESISENSLVTS